MPGAAKERTDARSSHTEGLPQLTALLDHMDDPLSIEGVVVVGAQSVGKTAVLRALADMKLYRAQDIITTTTTRAPIVIIRLQTLAVPGSPSYAFIHGERTSGAKVFDLADIGAEMEAYAAAAATLPAGAGAGTTGGVICETPIYLQIVRSSGPTITIIDIPVITGMTSSVDCATQHGVHVDAVSLVKSYLRQNENMAVLVVIPALAESVDAELALANTLDPENQRTYGVVTQVGNVQYALIGQGYASKPPMDAGRVYLYLGFLAPFTGIKDQNMTPQELRDMEELFVTSYSAVYVTREKRFWGLTL